MRTALVLIWVSMFAGTAVLSSGELSCAIEVNVEDDLGNPLQAVRVTARAAESNTTTRGVTDSTGRLELFGLVPQSYRLEVDLVGYQWLEVEAIRCPPAGAVRLWLELESVEGDEIVILPSGPVVDAESAHVGWWLDRHELEVLPVDRAEPVEGDVVGGGVFETNVGAGLPMAARQWQGLYLASSGVGGEAPSRVVARTPPAVWHSEAEADGGIGAGAAPTGTRGSVETLERRERVAVSTGGRLADSRAGLFIALEGTDARTSGEAEFSRPGGEGGIDNENTADIRDALAAVVVRWQAADAHALDLHLSGAVIEDSSLTSTLYVGDPSALPLFDRKRSEGAVRVGWSAVGGDRLRLRLAARAERRSMRVQPQSALLNSQDQTPDGAMSGGFGNGIWSGAGGIAGVDDARRLLGVDGDFEWAAGTGHRLTAGLAWTEDRRETAVDADGGGSRRYWLIGGRSRLDELAPPSSATGVNRRKSLFVHDVWRVERNVTVLLDLGLRDVSFSSGAGRAGYHLGMRDTASYGLGVVWDFEGYGRSRVWVGWSRHRPDVDEVVHYRLSGALDVGTVIESGVGDALEVRPPGAVAVAPEMTLAVDDEVSFGVEYEPLSSVVIGVAGGQRRSRDGVATMSDNGGRSFFVGTPEGALWERGLRSRRWSACAWARKLLTTSWQAAISVQWSRSEGTWSGAAPVDFGAVDREYLRDVLVPDALVNAWGPLPDDREWRVEVLGSWTLASGPVLGARLSYVSGAPVSMLGALSEGFGLDRRFVVDRGGAGRTPGLWNTDVVCSWPLEIGRGRLTARAEIRNLLNRQAAVSVDERWSLLDQAQAAGLDPEAQLTPGTWGEPMHNQRPLEARLGVSYRW